MWNSLPDYCRYRLDAHWKQRDFFISLSSNLYRSRRLEFMLSIRKLMSVVKDVDLEAMPSSIFVNDDDDDDDDDQSSLLSFE